MHYDEHHIQHHWEIQHDFMWQVKHFFGVTLFNLFGITGFDEDPDPHTDAEYARMSLREQTEDE